MMEALQKQVGGVHYKGYKIQPVEFIFANGIGFLEGNAIKYICRHKKQSTEKGKEDIKKAIHYLEMLLELEYPPLAPPQSNMGRGD
jgi:hypothetical protein